jgi:hypothetical protein
VCFFIDNLSSEFTVGLGVEPQPAFAGDRIGNCCAFAENDGFWQENRKPGEGVTPKGAPGNGKG